MDNSFIIQRGDTAKYQLTIEHEDFDQNTGEFFVILPWGMKRESLTIQHSAMIQDEDGNWFVIFDSSAMLGKVTAETHYIVEDGDMPDDEREIINRKIIGLVTESPCPRLAGCSCEADSDTGVTWKRVYRSDVGTLYMGLRTCDQEPILDSQGNQLRVRKSNLN